MGCHLGPSYWRRMNTGNSTFSGKDNQFQAAPKLLKKEVEADSRPVHPTLPFPDKSFRLNDS